MSSLEKILSLAREQIGVTEQPPGSNNVIYNTDYYGGPVQGGNYPWCCAFIWWLFWKSGLSALFCGGQKTAYCPFVVNWARQHGQWVDGDYRPGDLLLYDWDGDGLVDHIGVCERLVGQAAIAIEGNCGDAVQEVTRSFVAVMGAYRPVWGEESAGKYTDTDAGDKPDTYTVQKGDYLGLIAARYRTTIQELVRLNNLSNPNLIYPGQVLLLRQPEPGVDQEPPEWSNADTEEARIDALARDVIAGKYGNGLARVFALGRDYDAVQARVNEILAGK